MLHERLLQLQTMDRHKKKKFWTLLNNDFWLDKIEDVCYLELLCHIYKATIALVGWGKVKTRNIKATIEHKRGKSHEGVE